MPFRLPSFLLFLTLFHFAAMAQTKYDSYWKKIDELIAAKNLPASAKTEVEKVYAIAKKEGKQDQLLKALVYQVLLLEKMEEDGERKGIAFLEKEIKTAAPLPKAVMKNMLASMYLHWYEINRYELMDRTAVTKKDPKNPESWSANDFHETIGKLYLSSLKNTALLQKTPLKGMNAVIYPGNTRELRPTLFDLLAHHALDYFRSDERDIEEGKNTFELNEASMFDPAARFITRKYTTTDSTSLQHKALQLFQQLIAFHLTDKDPAALIDVDLKRIEFVYEAGSMDDKRELYRNSLTHITSQYNGHPASSMAWFKLAQLYEIGDSNLPSDNHQDKSKDFVKAKQICEQVIARNDSSEGQAACQTLLANLQQKQLEFNIEKVNQPGQPFRILTTYRNTPQVYLKVVAFTKELKVLFDTHQDNQDTLWQILTQQKAIQPEQSIALPGTSDLKGHTVEIKIDALPVGEYGLILSTQPDFKMGKGPMAFSSFYVSNIAYFNQDNQYYVVHRETGKPIPRAGIQVWYSYYDNQDSKYKKRQGENLFSDSNGFFEIARPQTNTTNSFRLEITTTDDHLLLDDNFYLSNQTYEREEEKPETRSFLFTDRKLYRPGQTVYFKGIVLKKWPAQNKKTELVPGFSSTIYLYDANRQTVDSIPVTTNAWGSFSGRFTLPSIGLTGSFNIEDEEEGGSATFNVEEYKRPRFRIELTFPKGTYKLGDEITLTGKAVAYSGNALNGAKVRYRVERNYQWPYWQMPRRGGWIAYPSGGKPKTIIQGELTTQGDGQFEVRFPALADPKIPREDQPVFRFTLYTDITDISGETRSQAMDVKVGYQALLLSLSEIETVNRNQFKEVGLRSENMNGQFEKVKVKLDIQSLNANQRLLRDRYWKQPDQFLYTAEEYRRFFPFDPYADESNPEKWPVLKTVASWEDSTREKGNIPFTGTTLPEGWYRITASTVDAFGVTVKSTRVFQLRGESTRDTKMKLELGFNEKSGKPGKTVTAWMRHSFDSAWILAFDSRKTVPKSKAFMKMGNENKLTEKLTTEDLGQWQLTAFTIRNNRFFTGSASISVEDSDQDIAIVYETWREKSLPGSQENWTLRITGKNAEARSAELLTAMYDASLDQILLHQWQIPSFYSYRDPLFPWRGDGGFSEKASTNVYEVPAHFYWNKQYDQLLIHSSQSGFWWTEQANLNVDYTRKMPTAPLANALQGRVAGIQVVNSALAFSDRLVGDDEEGGSVSKMHSASVSTVRISAGTEGIPLRKNFSETAFFFPDLHTDSSGAISFSFTLPESLTTWKWMNLAHTKDAHFAYGEKSIITQKDLMVQANAPRFLREGDRMDFSAKIVNMTNQELTGQVELQLVDLENNQPVDGWFRNFFPNQYFTVPANESVAASFSIEIPFQYNRPVIAKLFARTDKHTDGEAITIPVVSNRMLVTESIPMTMDANGSKTFSFEKLKKSGGSETLNHHSLTVEFTSNPVWSAVQALPYLMEFPHECAEQSFNRYTANVLSTYILNSNPRIKAVVEEWSRKGAGALQSNLSKNPELRSLLLQETPWVLEARTDAEQQKRLADLLDLSKAAAAQNALLDVLKATQLESGGFPWFAGGPDNRYITQYILTGIGHLLQIGALNGKDSRIQHIIERGLQYADNRISESYSQLVKSKANLAIQQPDAIDIQYIYMRSFFSGRVNTGSSVKAVKYYREQAKKFWVKQRKPLQAMTALALFRSGETTTAQSILRSLEQNALVSKEMGMYWKDFNQNGYFWFDAAIESHALLTEAFWEIRKDLAIDRNLKLWLLRQKQTSHWPTTKATAEACYVLLATGERSMLNSEPTVEIRLGSLRVQPKDKEAGSGYFKTTVDPKLIKPEMGNITVELSGLRGLFNPPSFGAVYWQYFENLDAITPAATGLQLKKRLYIEKNTDRGPVLTELKEGDALHVGDKVKVRIELKSDRMLEYVYLKDMRAAALEPQNVLSGYSWQGGLGYYQSTKDAATHFFFDVLRKGTYIFEYTLFATHTGTFSNGVSTIQCMYAPEFTSHSEGLKIIVE